MYLPVKILDKQWADELMKGNVYMRALADFGAWNLQERIRSCEHELNNDYRSDSLEGIMRNLAPDEKDVFFDALPDEWKQVVSSRFYIDEGEKYTHLFCMYRLLYEKETDTFSPMCPDMRQFGDTAVIITDPEEFLRRVLTALSRMMPGRLNIGASEVHYQDLDQDYGTWNIFCKEKCYRWQQEVRLFASLKEELALKEDAMDLKTWTDPWTVCIGDLRDIAVEVPAEDLVCGKIPDAVFDPKVRERLLSCDSMPLGVTDQMMTLFSDFSGIEPQTEDIRFWQQIFPESQWQPLTFMQQVSPGGQAVPRLSFHHKDKRKKIFFFYERVEIRTGGDQKEADDLLELFLKTLCQKESSAGKQVYFQGLNLNCLVNMGTPKNQYLKNQELQIHFSRLLSDFGDAIQERGQLTLSALKCRNIFGMDIMDNAWCCDIRFGTNMEKTSIIDNPEKVPEFFRYSRDLMEQRIRYLSEGGDPYERFCHL